MILGLDMHVSRYLGYLVKDGITQVSVLICSTKQKTISLLINIKINAATCNFDLSLEVFVEHM